VATVAEVFSLAWKHHQAGGFSQAEQLYRQILQADPSHADACCFLGAACQAQGKLAEAERHYRQAVRLMPAYAGAHNCLGMLLAEQGQLTQAVASFQQGLRAQPHNAEIHNNLGLALARQGKMVDAVGRYRQALRLNPDYAAAHYNLGLALNAQGQHDAAIAAFQQALHFQPAYPEAWNDLGNALAEQEKLEEAVSSYRQALRLRPDYAEAHYNLGVVFVKQGRDEEAMAHYHQALRSRPNYADAHFNLANALHSQGRIDEAMTHFLDDLRLRPDRPETNLSCALVWLIRGDFERGWPAYEWRWRQPDSVARPFVQPLWDGPALDGRTILLHAELGLGDTLQFIRYAPLVKQRGGKVIVECQSALPRLLASAEGIDHLVARGSPLPSFDVQAPLLSLPAIMQTALTTVPRAIPYLQADAGLVAHWRQELRKSPKSKVESPKSKVESPKSEEVQLTSDFGLPTSDFLVGIAWQGNPVYGHDPQRSIPLAQFAPLAQVEGVRLISLQKGPGAEQLREPFHSPLTTYHRSPSTVHRPPSTIHDLGSRLDEASGAFMDTAAIMKSLDLVVSSDTAIPHLAGALGVPIWLALPLVPDWRWLLEREDSPWYPTMRVFRQRRRGDWEDVFHRIAEELKAVVSC